MPNLIYRYEVLVTAGLNRWVVGRYADKQMAEVIARAWRELGYTVEVPAVPKADFA